MDLLYKSLKIARNKRIYHVNTDEFKMKRILKKYLDKKSNILYLHEVNRMNIDVVFISNSYIDPRETTGLIVLRDHYKDSHAILQVFFGSYSLLNSFYKERKRNPNAYMFFNHKMNGAFFRSLEKKHFYLNYCFQNDNNVVIKTPYQFSMFDSNRSTEAMLDLARLEMRETESRLLNLIS